MGFGPTSSALSVCLCITLLLFTVTDARPKETKETFSDWSGEWQQAADSWKPKTEKDSWRAFEPSVDTTTRRWWEEKLDDDLWDSRTANTVQDKPQATLDAAKAVPEIEGEKKIPISTNTPMTEPQTEASEKTTASIKPVETHFGEAYYKKGELNTFVEPDPGTYYRLGGDKFGEKNWDTLNSPSYQSNFPAASAESEWKDKAPAGAEDDTNVAKTATDESSDELKKDSKQALTSSGSSSVNNSSAFQGKNVPVSDTDLSDDASVASEDVESDDVKDEKKADSVGQDANAIYGKGESIAMPSVGAMNGALDLKVKADTAEKEKEGTTKKPVDDFVDWADWDSSVFDDYDDDEEDEDEEDADEDDSELSSESSSSSSSEDFDSFESEDDDDDEEDDVDEYYDWDDDWDDVFDEDEDDYDDEDDDEKDSIYELEGDSIEANKLSGKEQKGEISWPEKGFDTDALEMQADEADKHADLSHYNKGIIYDSSLDSKHKPSVKKDLTNPANQKREEGLSKTNQGGDIFSLNDIQKGSVKKESSVTHFQPDHLNTQSDASTSPNPPPPDVGGRKDMAKTLPLTTTPVASSDEMILAAAENSEQEVEDMQGMVLSFPLEFCKVDFECRAGRTCVQGVCKCVLPTMCAGHHKPICGSDGKQYPSHCELHRTACVRRVHIRVDRRGRCFQEEIQEKEKSWLMEQERLLQEDKQRAEAKQNPPKPSQEIYQYPQDIQSDQPSSDVKKAYVSNKTAATTTAATSTTTTTTTIAAAAKKECTWKEMGEFKEALLMYYCQKFVEPNCKLEVKTDREYLSMLMFSYYDEDFDYYLTAQELDDKERDEHFSKNIIINCHLHDFVTYADTVETDGKLTVSEFTNSFALATPSTPPMTQIEVIPTLATAGNGLELKCGIDAVTVVWRRHGSQLSDDKRSHQLMVFDDGALFFSKVGLHHIGNYTCADADDETNAQVHRLRVQTLPIVHVNPVTQTHHAGSDIELKCHAEGVPSPTITWKQGGDDLPSSPHATHYYGGGHVVIHNAQFDADAGTYTCSAHNQAGTAAKSVSVSIQSPTSQSVKESAKEVGTFVVFHSKGISAFDPLRCLLRHKVFADFGDFKFIPEVLDGPMKLCRKDEECQWGGAVKVGSDFIYVSQPDQDRVVVVDARETWSPLQVIDTDKHPEKLWYVPHLDQVWVLCGKKKDGDSSKTIVVIRDASQHIQHRSVHTRPVGNHFDMVQDLFIAPTNDLEHEFDFGYVSHGGQNGLFKLNLEDMSYTKAIDLTNYGCVPTNIAFVPIGGHVIIQCVSAVDHHTLQLTMDYLTDTITSTTSLNGRPMTSPDSRHMVTVDEFTGKVTVASVSDEGVMEVTYEVTVSASISDVAFMPASAHHGYDLVLTSADDDDVIIMNLVTGKVEKISGSQYSDPSSSWHPSNIHRHIISGNTMSNYLMAPSRSSLAILDAKFKEVECEFLDTHGSDVMIHIPSSSTN